MYNSKNGSVVKVKVVARHDNGDLAVKYENRIGVIPSAELYDNSISYFFRNQYKEILCNLLEEEPLTFSVKKYVMTLKKEIMESICGQYPYYVEGTVVSVSGGMAFLDIGGLMASLSIQDFCRARMRDISAVLTKGEVVSCRIKRLYDAEAFLSQDCINEERFSEVWLERDKASCIAEAEKIGLMPNMLLKAKLGERDAKSNGRFVLLTKDLGGMVDNAPLLSNYKAGEEIAVKVVKIKELTENSSKIRCEFIGPASLVDNGSEFIMPELVSLNNELAKSILSSCTAKMKIIYEEGLSSGIVGRTEPCAGETVSADTVVTIYTGHSDTFLINKRYQESTGSDETPDIFSVGNYTYRCLGKTNHDGIPMLLRRTYSMSNPGRYLEVLKMLSFLHYATKDMLVFASERLKLAYAKEPINDILAFWYKEGAIQYYLKIDENNHHKETAIYSLSATGKELVKKVFHIQMTTGDFTRNDEPRYIMARLAENRVMLSSELNLKQVYAAYIRTHNYVTNYNNKRMDLHRIFETTEGFELIEGVRVYDDWKNICQNKLERMFDYISTHDSCFNLTLVCETPEHIDTLKEFVSEMSIPHNLNLIYVHDKQFVHKLVIEDELRIA